jgi:hypothetical protein
LKFLSQHKAQFKFGFLNLPYLNDSHNFYTMAAKQKITRQKKSSSDKEENSKFMLIVVLATLALMVLMYLIYVR